jgi:hypothetical protein
MGLSLMEEEDVFRQSLQGWSELLGYPQALHRSLSFQEWLPGAFVKRISQLDTQSPVTKINGKRCLIVSAL